MSASLPSEGGFVALCAQLVAAAAAAAAVDDDDDDERSGRYTNLSTEIQRHACDFKAVQRTIKHRPQLSHLNVVASLALSSVIFLPL